jgi:hypothetical protein
LSPGQICVAKVLGSFVFPLLHDLHFDACALHYDVHSLQASAFPREQTSGAARDLIGQIGRSGIQISSVGSICQSVTIMREYSESNYEAVASSVRRHVISCQWPCSGATRQFWCAFGLM